ncbi:helix-hairpin-helix domain-containing protein [Streptomyces sp. H10-C2]|uniref:helix-hairpin-helix domain-containing protein n=1 Tax=unclassified Streptomyces TaxID=2593676 RepID=UPI0024BADC9C|nr:MULTISPECIES: helix-hairpin-helix domain-containing protein [unclassified Streptomyces]MDJ0344578.1 helix-hairpin-helix domain-containing protein [Streptomyces sp. PH10-H1]MDJ0371013.1 helix-hairpin-helix domain-containing protein [Streptomyces sp. H10-C2]
MRSIERGDNPAAPAPKGDAAAARRKRREAMAAEAAKLQAAEAAAAAGVQPPTAEVADASDAETGVETAAESLPGDDGDSTEDTAAPDPAPTGTDSDPAEGPATPGPAVTPARADAQGAARGATSQGAGSSDSGTATTSAPERAEDAVRDSAAERPADSRPDGGAEAAAGTGEGRPGGPTGSGAVRGQAPAGQSDEAQGVRGAIRPARVPVAYDPAAVEAARAVLTEGGAPAELAEPAVAALGERAAQTLREDPWQVLALAGVRVEHADGFARALLGGECGPDDERRVRALVVWLLERAAEQGHTALESSVLRTALEKQSVSGAEEGLTAAIAEGRVLVFQDAEDVPGAKSAPADEGDEAPPVRLLLGLDRYALAEESLADGLDRLLKTFEGDDLDWEAAATASPSPSAAALVRAAAACGLVTHTGGEAARAEPAALVAAARTLGLRAYAAAYTEEGRRRLAARLGADDTDVAVTVAGLLSGQEGPGREADGSLALDVLAVLDAPQLDVELAATLVEAVPDGARLVLSGDPGVLWSVGPGRAFADLLAAKTCPQVASRTPDPGPIGELVSGIGIGELTAVEAPGKEVVIVPVRDPREAVHRTVQLVADSVPRVIGVPAGETQVITPGHGGAVGTQVLNAALKERLNPGPGRFGGFDPGDRVVYAPEPGLTLPGTVVSADPEGLYLDCAGTRVLVPRDQVAALRHGWAMTTQQSAGLRWPAVVVVLPGDAVQALTRAWVYTAFGRGERHLSVVQGADQGLAHAVAAIPAKDRTTRLRSVLREQAVAE